REERASLHSITSSARAGSVGGRSGPPGRHYEDLRWSSLGGSSFGSFRSVGSEGCWTGLAGACSPVLDFCGFSSLICTAPVRPLRSPESLAPQALTAELTAFLAVQSLGIGLFRAFDRFGGSRRLGCRRWRSWLRERNSARQQGDGAECREQ